jgi:hypothetical protein
MKDGLRILKTPDRYRYTEFNAKQRCPGFSESLSSSHQKMRLIQQIKRWFVIPLDLGAGTSFNILISF